MHNSKSVEVRIKDNNYVSQAMKWVIVLCVLQAGSVSSDIYKYCIREAVEMDTYQLKTAFIENANQRTCRE